MMIDRDSAVEAGRMLASQIGNDRSKLEAILRNQIHQSLCVLDAFIAERCLNTAFEHAMSPVPAKAEAVQGAQQAAARLVADYLKWFAEEVSSFDPMSAIVAALRQEQQIYDA
jgi:hypothetical protein